MFNERLRKLRKESGFTQQEIADVIGVSSRVYAYYETERIPNNEIIIKKLTECFDCSTDYLFGISEFKNYEEMKKDYEKTILFGQIEDPGVLENMKGIFSKIADIGEDANSYAMTNCLKAVADSINEISASYSLSLEEVKSFKIPLNSMYKGLNNPFNNIKLLEFKAFSTEKIEAVNESIKKLANELANKIKEGLEQNNDKEY